MSKANKIKKSKYIDYEYVNSSNDSTSVNLFDVCGSVSLGDHSNSSFRSKQEKRQEKNEKERRGAQSISAESRINHENFATDRERDTVSREGDEKCEQHSDVKTRSSDGKGISHKRSSKRIEQSGTGYEKGTVVNNGTNGSVGEGKQKTERVSRKRSKKERECQVDERDLYEFSDFSDSSSISQHRTIQAGPFLTDDETVVEIVMDNLKYKVSSWSVKDNIYVQGLDSIFISNHYFYNKHE